MADTHQYLRLQLGKVNYLLPSTSSFSIEQRESMIPNPAPRERVAAWRTVRSGRWPAYCLDDELKVTRRDGWQRAVFLEARPVSLGIIVDEVQLLPRSDTEITPFIPLGAPPTRFGHLFSGAWITGKQVMLVFEARALVAYLQSIGD
jgi:hypothetical protein